MTFHGVWSPEPVLMICVSGSPDFVSCFFHRLCYVECRAQIAQEEEKAVCTCTHGNSVQCWHLANDRNVRSDLGCHKPPLLSVFKAAFSISAGILGFGLLCMWNLVSAAQFPSFFTQSHSLCGEPKQREDTLLITPSVSQGCS